MKFLLQIIAVIALGWLLTQFLPWWSAALAGGLVAFGMTRRPGRSFLAGLLGIFILWSVVALIKVNATGSDLPDGFAQLLPIPLSGTGLVFFSALIGGLVGGLGGMTGSAIRKLVFPQRRG